jgi:hypothetical protein
MTMTFTSDCTSSYPQGMAVFHSDHLKLNKHVKRKTNIIRLFVNYHINIYIKSIIIEKTFSFKEKRQIVENQMYLLISLRRPISSI